MKGWRSIVDAVLITVILVAGTVGVRAYVERVAVWGARPSFYQGEFGPAVMAACGRGFKNPVLNVKSPLLAFLATQSDRFDCASLPAEVPTTALTGPQVTWRYLMWSVALTWITVGEVTWPAIYWLSGVLFGVTAAAAYVGTRLFAGPVLAFAVALLLLTSPLQLRHTPLMRDYAKAPFMVAIGVLLAVIVTKRLSARAQAIAGALFGIVLGIGVGFRNDLLIAIPAFVLAGIVAGLRMQPGKRMRSMAGTIGAGAAGFVVVTMPLWGAYSAGGGASMTHVALLGLAPQFDPALGVQRSPLYGFGHSYDDSVMATVILQHASSALGYTGSIKTYDPTYDRASNSIARNVLTWLPADIWLRALASATNVIRSPASGYDDGALPAIDGAPAAGIIAERERWFNKRSTTVAWLVVAGFVAGAIVDPIATLAVVLITVYFAGYPAIQFHLRHSFHLEVVPLVAMAYLLASFWRLGKALWFERWRPTGSDIRAGFRNAGVVCAFVAVLLVLPLVILRPLQDARLGRLFDGYLAAARDPIQIEDRQTETGNVLLAFPPLPAAERAEARNNTVFGEFIVVEVRSTCSTTSVDLGLEYDNERGRALFNRVITVPRPSRDSTTVFFPAYYSRQDFDGPNIRFALAGLSTTHEQRGCIGAIARVRDASAFPLWMDLVFPARWRELPRHQLIAGWERAIPEGWSP